MNKIFDDFLEKVEKYLRPLPLSERMDIIQEINSQICELKNAGKTSDEILERLGSAKELAKAYLSDLIVERKALSFNKILAFFAYYTLAGFTGIIIIPILLICAPVFMFCGVVTPILTFIKMLNYILNLGLPYINHIVASVGTFQLNPVLEFLVSLPIAGLLFGVGWICWKLLIAYIKSMGTVKQHMIFVKE